MEKVQKMNKKEKNMSNQNKALKLTLRKVPFFIID